MTLKATETPNSKHTTLHPKPKPVTQALNTENPKPLAPNRAQQILAPGFCFGDTFGSPPA